MNTTPSAVALRFAHLAERVAWLQTLLDAGEVEQALRALDDLVVQAQLASEDVETLAALTHDRAQAGIIHRCSCGVGYDLEGWRLLPYCGVMGGGEGGQLELRVCSNCQSSRSIRIATPVTSVASQPSAGHHRGESHAVPAGGTSLDSRSHRGTT